MNNTLQLINEKFLRRADVDWNWPALGRFSSPIELREINRTIMAQTLGELGFKNGAEIGVAEGYHAEVLYKNIPELVLTCVDAWKHYDGYQEYDDLDIVFDKAMQVLRNYPHHIIQDFSLNAANKFPDNYFDFVYLDAGHDFLNIAQDISIWSKKVKVGGIVFGHDYKHRASQQGRRFPVHVKDVVDAYMSAHEISPWFILTNDIKDPRFGRDNQGWMFVRQESDRL